MIASLLSSKNFHFYDSLFYNEYIVILSFLIVAIILSVILPLLVWLAITYMTNGSGETAEVSNLSAVSEQKRADGPRGLLKIFWDPSKLSQEGPSRDAIQARLIQGQGVRWLSVFMQPGFRGIGIYGDFPLAQPLDNASLKAQLSCSGAFTTPTRGRLELLGFSLSEIPEGGCQIIQTNNMANETLNEGFPIPVRNTPNS